MQFRKTKLSLILKDREEAKDIECCQIQRAARIFYQCLVLGALEDEAGVSDSPHQHRNVLC